MQVADVFCRLLFRRQSRFALSKGLLVHVAGRHEKLFYSSCPQLISFDQFSELRTHLHGQAQRSCNQSNQRIFRTRIKQHQLAKLSMCIGRTGLAPGPSHPKHGMKYGKFQYIPLR